MSKGTIILFFILTVIATLLVGINIGKNLNPTKTPSPTVSSKSEDNITPSLSPVKTVTNTEITPSITGSVTEKGARSTSTYTDESCGFTFSIPGSYIKSSTQNGRSTIIADPDNPGAQIAATCAATLPRPPLTAENIEAFTIDNESAVLYHDKAPDGKPRDEVIVKHPNKNLEIIIAGYGPIYEQVLSSFKFTL